MAGFMLKRCSIRVRKRSHLILYFTQQALQVLPSSEGRHDYVCRPAAQSGSQLLRSLHVLESSEQTGSCGQLSSTAGKAGVSHRQPHMTKCKTRQPMICKLKAPRWSFYTFCYVFFLNDKFICNIWVFQSKVFH